MKELTEREAAALAKKAGMERLAALQAGKDARRRNWGASRAVTRDNPAGLSAAAVTPVFRVDPAKLPAYAGVDDARRLRGAARESRRRRRR